MLYDISLATDMATNERKAYQMKASKVPRIFGFETDTFGTGAFVMSVIGMVLLETAGCRA